MNKTLDDYPDYADAMSKRRGLLKKLNALDARAGELGRQLCEVADSAADDPLNAQAARLLNGGAGEPVEAIDGADLLDQLRQTNSPLHRQYCLVDRSRN